MEHLKFQFERRKRLLGKGQIKLEMEGLLLTLTYAADTAEGASRKTINERDSEAFIISFVL